jgi:hypothetical protein
MNYAWAAAAVLVVAVGSARAAELKPETLQGWDAYIAAAKQKMEARAKGESPFLRLDETQGMADRVRGGEIVVDPEGGYSPHPVENGLIHDWVGAIFIPGAQLDDVARVLDSYDRYTTIYKPMVADAKLETKSENHEKVKLLMTQKTAWITAAVETENEVDFFHPSADKIYSLSTSASVHEISDYGTSNEHPFAPDQGPGYVWRTFTVTRLEQRDGGVYEELEMIALSRGIPWYYRWIVDALVERMPRNILAATLEDTRNAVRQGR